MYAFTMNRKQTFLVIFYLLILAYSGCSNNTPKARDLVFFYMETCPSCENYQRAEKLGSRIFNLNKKSQWNGAAYNVANPENGAKLKKILTEKKLPDISRSLPLLILDNEYYNGYEAIEEILENL